LLQECNGRSPEKDLITSAVASFELLSTA